VAAVVRVKRAALAKTILDSAPEPPSRWRVLEKGWARLQAMAARLLPPEAPPLVRPSEVGVDRVPLGTVLVLLAFGIVMVFSSGAVFAAKKYGDSAYFLKRELVYALLGLGALSVALRID